MQEIKFRAKRKDNKDWVEGMLCRNTKGELCIQDEKLISEGNIFCLREVDPDTVGQYIGIKDRKGQDVFNKMKVDCYIDGKKNGVRDVIEFKDGAFYLRHRRLLVRSWMEITVSGEIEIVN